MPFQEPFAVDNPAFPNTAQPTVNVGIVGGAINVQGGGETLFDQFGNMGAGTEVFEVPAPPSGLTYFGIGVILTVTKQPPITSDVPMLCRILNFGPDLTPIQMFATDPDNVGTSVYLGEFGHPRTVAAAVPVATRYPIIIELEHFYASDIFYHLTVLGLSAADVIPRDLGMWETINLEPRIIFNNAPDEAYGVIAASFETRDFLFSTSGVAGGDILVDVLSDAGVWTISQTRAHNSIFGGKLTASGSVAETNSVITIPGNGAIHRVRTGTDMAGSICSLSYQGKR
jgi:hypothetical protein